MKWSQSVGHLSLSQEGFLAMQILGLTDNLLQHPKCYSFCSLIPSLMETVIRGGWLWIEGELPLPFGLHNRGQLSECARVRE